MRIIVAVVFLLASSLSALANSYTVQGGYFNYYGDLPGYWTPKMLGINVGGQTPHMIPFTFNSATLSVECLPACAVGDSFLVNLSMSNFVDRQSGLLWNGTIDLVTQPVTITSLSGVDIARFVLTGSLLGCYDTITCVNTINITPNLHGYLTVDYSLVGGQMEISSMSYSIPEPATMILVGTGLLATGLLRRRKSLHA
jgi:hypothetical protein